MAICPGMWALADAPEQRQLSLLICNQSRSGMDFLIPDADLYFFNKILILKEIYIFCSSPDPDADKPLTYKMVDLARRLKSGRF